MLSGVMTPIPFNKPTIVGNELAYVAEAVRSGKVGADGVFTDRCCRLLERRLGIAKILLTTSCTSALEIACQLADLKPGDEVLVPSFTYVSTASAVVRLGARPVFLDIRPDTFNLDELEVEKAITPRTRAIIAVHYGGIACAMTELQAIAQKHGLFLIEDAAHGVDAFFAGQALGSMGSLGCLSFHETKNCSCGQGGALCINRPELADRAERIRAKGTNRRDYQRGVADHYTWTDLGSGYAPNELTAAFLLGQLEQLDTLTARRRVQHARYHDLLSKYATVGRLTLPASLENCQSNGHLFPVLLAGPEQRGALMSALAQAGIQAAPHYVPLHRSPMGRQWGIVPSPLRVTEAVSGRLLRLPLFHELTEAQQARVAATVGEFLEGSQRRAA
ncbi:MAG: dTDP-4-amino-4,6-dideoxygalactose transaminase [Planctomycetes bacterium]|nr:dTDP-4-amino-4,6-dideoxygalactose transaminase [Planctomycetota bacterium]